MQFACLCYGYICAFFIPWTSILVFVLWLCLYFTSNLTICSTMIDIIQWRASIGGFNISVQSVRNTCIDNNIWCDNIRCDSLEFIEYEVPSTCHYFPIVWFLSVYYVLNIFFQICLILSGDIETNPGPISYKTCPSCDAQIPIRKKICLCGYAFSQKYQQ